MLKDRILRCWWYFRRGHSTYLAFFLSFANFIVIQYNLYISKVLDIPFHIFALVFPVVYVSLAVFIGWIDRRKGAVPVDVMLVATVNPWVRDLAKALKLMNEGRHEEASQILERWCR